MWPSNQRETLEVTVLRWAHGGDGVAFPEHGELQGVVLFVPGAVPGDRLRVAVTERRKRFARAEIVDVLAASPQRVTPECPVQSRCGGCPWMVGSSAAQRASRRAILVGEAHKRLGWDAPTAEARVRLDPTPIPRVGYRQRLKLGYRVMGEGVHLGFRRAQSHQLIDVPGCAVAHPQLQAAHGALRAALTRRPPGETGEVRLVAGSDGVAGQIRPAGRPPIGFGQEEVRAAWPGPTLVLRPDAFCQANPYALASLHRDLAALARETGAREAVELYAGSGALTTALLEAGLKVTAYELEGSTRPIFERTTAPWPGQATWHGCDLALWGAPRPEPPAADLVLVDPPRRGAAELVPWLLARRPPWIAWVSCDPATASRDLAALQAGGYTVASITGYDMFPHTGHQELLAVARRELKGSRT
jgi:23S rRNA (uracil1939-C5)-methyltransferase